MIFGNTIYYEIFGQKKFFAMSLEVMEARGCPSTHLVK